MVCWDDAGKKMRLSKYFLTMNLREVHALYLQEHRDENYFSLIKMCKLLQTNLLLIGSTHRDQCKFQQHDNFFMKLEAMGVQYDRCLEISWYC